jgi:hypothetical protein
MGALSMSLTKSEQSSFDFYANQHETRFQKLHRPLEVADSKASRLDNDYIEQHFTMRLIGNKTHGDLAEIGIMEFVNQYQ